VSVQRNHLFVSYIYLHPLSFSIIKLDSYARSLRRSDKPPSKIPSLANTSSEKYTNHESLTSREWYYPRVVAGKSRFCTSSSLAWLEQIGGGDQRSGQRRPWASSLSLISRIYPEAVPLLHPQLHLDAVHLMALILTRNWCDWKLHCKIRR